MKLFSKIKKHTASTLILVIFASSIALPISLAPVHVEKAEARFVIEVGANLAANAANLGINTAFFGGYTQKEYILDPLVWIIVKILVRELAKQIIAWIASEFDGFPIWIGNPQEFLRNITVTFVGTMLEELVDDPRILCESHRVEIVKNVAIPARQFAIPTIPICTLEDSVTVYEDFAIYGFEGFDRAIEVSNNPIGAVLQQWDIFDAGAQRKTSESTKNLDNNENYWMTTCLEEGIYGCLHYFQVNPGSAIENQIQYIFNQDLRDLSVADELSELLSSVATALVSMALSSTGIFSPSGQNPAVPGIFDSAIGAARSNVDSSQTANPVPTITSVQPPRNIWDPCDAVVDGLDCFDDGGGFGDGGGGDRPPEQCQDGIDNDGDGYIDYRSPFPNIPSDLTCRTPYQDYEEEATD